MSPWPVDSADGLRPPALTTGPSAASSLSIPFMLDFTMPASGRTNRCPGKPGAAQRVMGDALRSRTDGRQATEVAIAVDALNRMLDLGRPEYVRIA
jgi:hypothetical protein